MSNYTKLTSYDTKDALSTGDPLKRIKGTELDDEFDAISTAIATKADSTSPTFSGTPSVPTATAGNNTTQAASTAFVTAAVSTATTPLAAKGSNSDITSLSGLTTALSVSQGGTGKTSATANSLLLGNGTSALQEVAPSTAKNILISNGTTWQSAAFPWNVTYINTSVSSGNSYTLPSNCIGVYIWCSVSGLFNAGAIGQGVIKDSSGSTLGTVYINGTNINNGGDGGSAMIDGAGSFIPVPSNASTILLNATSGSNPTSFVVQAYVTV